jgi:peptide/nickel transport system substrate-binding protein
LSRSPRRLAGSLLGLILLWMTACATPSPAAGPAANPAPAAPSVSKTITIGQLNPTKSYGPWEFSQTSGGGPSLAEVHTIGLVSEDRDGNPEPRLAAALPSLEAGTIRVLPDGRMETTWRLRAGVTWQDGAPFTADDVVFSWDIARHPDLTSSISTFYRQVESAEAVDPLSVRITWRTTFYRALDLGHRNLWLFPYHLLGAAFEGDKQAFLVLPYFTTEYVHLGPFRLADFGQGERQVFERFDGYFLGRPRVDRIVLQTISDPNTLLTSLRAGAVDIVTEKVFPSEMSVQIRDEYRRNGAGALLERQDNWPYIRVQFDPRWAQPAALSRDVRIRRGLLYGVDRDTLREIVLPGFADTSGDTFMLTRDRRSPTVGQPFAPFRYDPTRASEELAAAGWQRGADGHLLSADGAPVQIEVRGENQNYVKEVPIIADWWRRLGLGTTEVIPTIIQAADREANATFPSVYVTSRGRSDEVFITLDSRSQATPQTRWQGANLSHYANPALDALIDRLEGTLDEREQGAILRDMGEVLATDLPLLPLYFRPSFVAVRRGIQALADDYAGTRSAGSVARHAHEWDRE